MTDRSRGFLLARNVLAVFGAAVLLTACGGSGAATQPPGAAASAGPVGSVAAASFPSDCAAFPPALADALKAALGGTAELDTADSDVDNVELDCTWRNTATGVGAIRAQVPRTADSFIDLVASQEMTGTTEFQPVQGFDEARQYGSKSFIATKGGLSVWIQANGVYPDLTADQFAAIAHAIVG